MELIDYVVVEVFDGDMVYVCGLKVINGEECIMWMLLVGLLWIDNTCV